MLTSDDIKKELANWYGNLYPDAKDWAKPNKWKRGSKFKVTCEEDFVNNEGRIAQGFFYSDLSGDHTKGTLPVDNTTYIVREFALPETEIGDIQVYVFTDSTDSHFVYMSGTSD